MLKFAIHFQCLASILLLSFSFSEDQRRINALNLLLPASTDHNAEFTLEALNSCYQFQTSDTSTLSVTSFDPKETISQCNTRIKVRVETVEPSKSITWLTATDISTGASIRCEGRVAYINSLQIITRQKQIDTGNFETIELMGFDEYGNAFSSLEGLRFQWKIKQDSPVAEFSSFRDSGFQASQRRQAIEDLQGRTDQIILKALRSGKFTLSVAFTDSKRGTLASSVELFIIDHIVVQPEEIVMLRCSPIQLILFRLKTNKEGKHAEELQEIDHRFTFRADNVELVDVSSKGLVTSKSMLGTAKVSIQDNDNVDSKLSVNINVVDVESAQIVIREVKENDVHQELQRLLDQSYKYKQSLQASKEFFDNQNLIKGRTYIVKPVLKSKDNKEIDISNEGISWQQLDKAIEIVQKTGQFIVIKATLQGKLTFKATIQKKSCTGTDIVAQKEMTVFTQLRIVLPRNDLNEVYLPSLSQSSLPQQLIIQTIGGSLSSVCQSNNPLTISFIGNNVVQVTGDGKAEVVCSDSLNKDNSDQVVVIVDSAAKVESLERHKEGVVDSSLNVLFTSTSSSANFFANCTSITIHSKASRLDSQTNQKGDSLPVDLSVINSFPFLLEYMKLIKQSNKFLRHSTAFVRSLSKAYYQEQTDRNADYENALNRQLALFDAYGVCAIGQLALSQEGSYSLEAFIQDAISSSSYVHVYSPIQLLLDDRYDQKTFGKIPSIAYGSSASFLIKKGPQQWLGKHLPRVTYSTSDNQQVTVVQHSQAYPGNVLSVSCKGIVDMQKARENFGKLVEPVEVMIQLQIQNSADEDLLDPVLMKQSVSINCAYPQNVKLFQLVDKSSKGFKFLDTHKSTLALCNGQSYEFVDWAFTSKQIPFWNFTSVQTKTYDPSPTRDASVFQIIPQRAPSHDKQAFHQLCTGNQLQSFGGNCFLLVFGEVSEAIHVLESIVVPPILQSFIQVQGDELMLLPSKATVLDPQSSDLLLFANNELEIVIRFGSGNFQVTNDSKEVISTIYNDNRLIIIRPLREGVGRIRVRDLGVQQAEDLTAEVTVLPLHSVQLTTEKNVLEVEDSTEAHVHLSQLLLAQVLKADLSLGMKPSEGLVARNMGQGRFAIKSHKQGEYKIVLMLNGAAAGNTVVLNVFSPLKAVPSKLLTMPRCQGYIMLEGGPEDMYSSQYILSIEDSKDVGEILQLQQRTYILVTGKKLQEGVIHFKLRLASTGNVISSSAVHVSLVFPDGLSIKGSQSLLQGATSLYQAFPSYKGTPFSPSICSYNFQFDIAQGSEIIALISLLQREQTQIPFGQVLVQASKPGSGAFSAAMAYDNLEQHAMSKSVLTSTYTIQVIKNYAVPQLSLYGQYEQGCSSFFGHSMILIPPNNSLTLPLGLTPVLIPHDNAIQLKDRLLSSSQKTGIDSLLLLNSQTSMQAGFLVKVQVPFQLLFENMEHVVVMHPKESYTLTAKFADEFGRLFPSPLASVDLQFLIKDPSIIEVSYDHLTQKLRVYSQKEGTSTVYAWSRAFPSLHCFITITVGTLITPEGPLFVHNGAKVHFKSLYKPEMDSQQATTSSTTGLKQAPSSKPSAISEPSQKSPARWESDDDMVLAIDKSSGVAHAKRNGKANVIINYGVAPKIEVNVGEIGRISFSRKNPEVITNIKTHGKYQQRYTLSFEPVLMPFEKGLSLGKDIDQGVDFDCTVDSSFVSARKPQGDPQEFACELTVAEDVTELVLQVTLTVRIFSRAYDFGYQESQTINVIHSLQTLIPSHSIRLTADQREAKVNIITPVKLKLQPDFSLQPFFSTQYFQSNKTQMIFLEFPEEVEDKVQGKIDIELPSIQEKTELLVSFDPEVSLWQKFSFKASMNYGVNELIVSIICIVLAMFIVREYRRNKKRFEESKDYNSVTRFTNLQER